MNKKKANNPQSIVYYLLKEWKVVLFTLIFGIGYNVVLVFVPFAQGNLLDSVINAQPLNNILITAVIFLAVVFFTQFCRYFKRYFVRNFANKTKRTMRLKMYSSALNLSLLELDDIPAGDLMTRCIGDVDITVEGIRKCITEILDTGVATVSFVVALLLYDVKATLLGCVFILFAMLIALVLKKTVYRLSSAYRKSSAELSQQTLELTSNAQLFKNFGVMNTHISRFNKTARVVKTKSIKATLIETSLTPLYNIISSFGVIFIIFLGGEKVLSQAWSVGTFTAFLSLFLAFTIKASKISKLFNSAQKAKISWERTKKFFFNEQISLPVKKLSAPISISVENLGFCYQNNSPVFQPVSFSAFSGDIIGIYGKIASGKTSLLLALTALYGYNGSVKVNEKELSLYSKEEKSDFISFSAHNPFLLDETIKDNVLLGRQDFSQSKNASMSENVTITTNTSPRENTSQNENNLYSLLSDVCFDKDFISFPDKENTVVGDNGIRLSGGQQSRISLCRALKGTNKIVLLDDPFSAVDEKTEREIISNIKSHHKDKIFIISSHRPTIFEYATKIICVKKSGE